MTSSRNDRVVTALLVALMIVAAGLRLGAAAPRAGAVFELGDSQIYRELGSNLASGRGLKMTDFAGRERVADRMPGYPALLAALDIIFGERATWALLVLQALAGAGTVLVVFLVAREICPGAAAGLAAAALVAVEPWQVYFSTVALTECWSGLFLAVTIYFALRAMRDEVNRLRWALAAGAACAALGYFHPEFLGLPVAFGVVALVASGRRKWLPVWAVATAVVVAALVPWWVRNYELLGRPVMATTRLGTTMWDGVRPGATGASDMRFEQEDADQTRGLNEMEYDAHYRRLALAAMAEEPGRMVRLAMTKAGRLWSPTPNAAMGQAWYYRWASAVGWAVMMAGAAIGLSVLLRRRGKEEATPSPYPLPSRERGEEATAGQGRALSLRKEEPATAAVVVLIVPAIWVTLVHLVLVGSVRYRVPVEPMLCILGGVGVAWLAAKWRTGER